MQDDFINYTFNSSNIPMSFTGTNIVTSMSWNLYQPPEQPSAPPSGVREPRRPRLPGGASSMALDLPEG
jgi:hypothetical protein